MEDSAFLGRGWAFPPMFGEGGRLVAMVEGEQDIEQSLRILFTTRLRERVLHHDFGADFERFIFEDIDQQLFTDLEEMIRHAVDTYEPRINLDRLDINPEPEEVTSIAIELEFTIRGTNTRHNMVFPFNLAEGGLYNEMIRV